MFTALRYFNFGEDLIKWVKLLYKNIESCVVINGHLSEWFSVQLGCRQGDPLSPYLFIIGAEILALMLKHNPNITGIKCNNNEFLLTQYADDTSVLLDGSEKSLRSTFYVLKVYADVSGLCLNVDKTKAIWIGSLKGSNALLCPDLNLTWENETFNLLGVHVSPKAIRTSYF